MQAYFEIGKLLEGEGTKVPEYYKAAFNMYAKAADTGHIASQHALAKMLQVGREGVPKDTERANQIFEKLRTKGFFLDLLSNSICPLKPKIFSGKANYTNGLLAQRSKLAFDDLLHAYPLNSLLIDQLFFRVAHVASEQSIKCRNCHSQERFIRALALQIKLKHRNLGRRERASSDFYFF